MTTSLPTMDEVALGAFLEDVGKFMQRARGSIKAMAPEVRARESDVLPPDRHGGYTHKHALWTDAFFDWMAGENLAFPDGIDANRVRDAAVYHHHPRTPLHWLSAIADRLSAGMDRKARDEKAEREAGDKGWDHFRKVPLKGLLDRVNLGLDAPPGETTYPVTELTPEAMFPAAVDSARLPEAYERLWAAFCEAFRALCTHAETVDQFHEGLLANSERFCWAIPSSTVDQPDISLHDHNRTVAALAACLYRFHEAAGDLDDEKAIKNPDTPKFRVLTGDLSGIQSSLFRLRSEGVKGANRILRARSFLIGQVGEAAAWRCRQEFRLPPYCLLQTAGGRFQLLVPNLPDAETRVDALRGDFDTWMLERYTGDLVVNLALSPKFSGSDFHSGRFAETLRRIAVSVDDAKQRPLAKRLAGDGAVIRASYPDGPCHTCGLRPATVDPNEPEVKRCRTCADEASLGRLLPRAVAVTWHDDRDGITALPDGLGLNVRPAAVDTAHDSGRRQRVRSGWRVRGNDEAGVFPVADRFVANHIPRLRHGDGDRGRYNDLSDEADEVKTGDAKLFEHLAADAREWLEPDGPFTGRAMLAVIKADVDRLGFVFAYGLGGDLSVGRAAQLSRMIDGFFTGYLDHLIRTRFPNTYSV